MAAEGTSSSGGEENAIQVCVRVRPLNDRERGEGHRTCVSFDDPTKQVVLTAVDKNTLLQLRGSTAKGYAFDRRYTQEDTSDTIYDDVVGQLVEKTFKGYNATVLAYGQTGSGKTHTMSGGVGIHGKAEEGVTPRVIRHLFAIADALKKRQKPGEKTEMSACALELYNEDLLDLSVKSGRDEVNKGWDASKVGAGLKLQERPVGKDGRVVPEVVGVKEQKVETAEELKKFFDECMENRSTSSTKLNDRSSRSHAIFTITIHRTIVEVLNELGDDFKARVRTSEFTSKLHLVDLAGSERVKRSGVTGKELKEATHINSGLLALGNVIVALSTEVDGKKKGHVPYRDSKLTRLLQDSLGGNSLTVLISCISPSEMDFEETNNTLKYANRACHIKNTPLPNKYTTLEEDLLPTLPSAGAMTGLGMVQLQALLEDHESMKVIRERKAREKAEKESRKAAALASLKDEAMKKPGFQRLRATQYDELRRQLAAKGATSIPSGQVIVDDTLKSFGRMRMSQSQEGLPITPGTGAAANAVANAALRRSAVRSSRAKEGSSESSPFTPKRLGSASQSVKAAGKPPGQSFADWLAAQQEQDQAEAAAEAQDVGTDDFFEQDGAGSGDFIIQDDEGEDGVIVDDDEGGEGVIVDDDEPGVSASASGLITDDGEGAAAAAAAAGDDAAAGKSKFRRGAAARKPDAEASTTDVAGMAPSSSMQSLEQEQVEVASMAAPEDEEVYDPIRDDEAPKLLARFKVNTNDVLAVFKATTKEDFKDVVGLLPENTPLPASDKMTYLLARLESGAGSRDMTAALQRVAAGEATMNEVVGPAVGCLMATFGTNMISSCIFEFEDPADLKYYGVEERIELWGLQIPHNSVRPSLDPKEEGAEANQEEKEEKKDVITWTSVDRLNMSIGLLYALCNHAHDESIRCGFCVPRPQLLRRWLQAGVRMKQIQTALKLIYPSSAHDYEYYKASTVAYFMVKEVREALDKVLAIVQ